MSIRALLKGVEKRLRSAAVLNDRPDEAVGQFVGVQPRPGRPPRNAGQWYVAVSHGGGRGADPNPQSHDVYHGVVVTLTARLNYAPKDRQGERLTTVDDVYDLVDRIAGPNVIHGNYDLLGYANELIVGTAEWAALEVGRVASVNGYLEPLVLGPFGPEREAGPGWVGSQGSSLVRDGVVSSLTSDVYVIDIRFNDARRIRPYLG